MAAAAETAFVFITRLNSCRCVGMRHVVERVTRGRTHGRSGGGDGRFVDDACRTSHATSGSGKCLLGAACVVHEDVESAFLRGDALHCMSRVTRWRRRRRV